MSAVVVGGRTQIALGLGRTLAGLTAAFAEFATVAALSGHCRITERPPHGTRSRRVSRVRSAGRFAMSEVTSVAAFWHPLGSRSRRAHRARGWRHAFMRGSSERVRTRARSVFRSMREPNLGISRNRCLALVNRDGRRRLVHALTSSAAGSARAGIFGHWFRGELGSRDGAIGGPTGVAFVSRAFRRAVRRLSNRDGQRRLVHALTSSAAGSARSGIFGHWFRGELGSRDRAIGGPTGVASVSRAICRAICRAVSRAICRAFRRASRR
jgi:hypothetical protein